MNYNSPKYGNKVNPPFRFSDEFKSPFTSPQNYSGQSFSPYSYSSPKNRNRNGPKRYFNCSTASTNSSSSNGSPYRFNRNNREAFHQNTRFSAESANISLYYDPTVMENPWKELEKEWEEKKKLALESENAEHNTSSK